MTGWTLLAPWKGRNSSLSYEVNLLCRSGDVYVMDNHRCAWWCWLQHLHPGTRHQVLHIDQHHDCRKTNLTWAQDGMEWARGLTLQEYLDFGKGRANRDLSEIPSILWDNYAFLHLSRCPDVVRAVFSTWDVGDPYPKLMPPAQQVIDPFVLPDELDCVLPADVPILVNIDIDINRRLDPNQTQVYIEGLPSERIEALGRWVGKQRSAGRVLATTIAISPECSGGWEGGARDAQLLLRAMGLEWSLPDV